MPHPTVHYTLLLTSPFRSKSCLRTVQKLKEMVLVKFSNAINTFSLEIQKPVESWSLKERKK
jgi:hypothetical protein